MPNFFLIGAIKAGTTSLYHYLRQHPHIYIPVIKETNFFSHDTLYKKGIKWYLGTHFRKGAAFPARGEASGTLSGASTQSCADAGTSLFQRRALIHCYLSRPCSPRIFTLLGYG